jgi:hypothetical protein
MNDSSSFESRARRLASRVDHEQLLDHAKQLQKDGRAAARVFWRALEMQREDRALQSSLTLTEVMGDAVYALRPGGRLPSDGIGLER